MMIIWLCLLALSAVSSSGLSLPWDIEWADAESTQGQTKTRSGTTCACGWTNRGRIVGGTETGKNEFPWMVSVELRGRHNCGGSILTPRHILTAAHCTVGLRPSSLSVKIGAHNLDDSGQIYYITKVINHEKYKHMTNDIALMITERQIRFSQNVGPVCLSTRRLDIVGETLTAIGWGRTSAFGSGSRRLLAVQLRVVGFPECLRAWVAAPASMKEEPDNLPIQEENMCTYAHRKDTCAGDSGGPLVRLDPETNRYTLAALVSYGGICGGSLPAVNVDASAYIDWINRNIAASGFGVNACRKM